MNPLLGLVAVAMAYFSAGAFREVICVSYYRSVSRKKDYAASGLARGLELYDILILSLIIKSGWSPMLIASYTAGVVVGTFVGTRFGK